MSIAIGRAVAGVVLVGLMTGQVEGQIMTPDGTGGMMRRQCSRASLPKQLPDPADLLDLPRLAERMGAGSTPVVVSVGFAAAGAVHHVRAVEPAEGAPAIEAAIEASLRPALASQEPWAVRVRIAGPDRVTIERAQYCPPVVVTGSLPPMPRITIPADTYTPPGGAQAVVEIDVLATGEAIGARLIRRSGIADLDRNLSAMYQGARYLPAQLDWMPVAGVYRGETRLRR